MTNETHDIDVTDELDGYLRALQREEAFRVDAVLKESSYERTERVSFVGRNGATIGPFVRKRIVRESGLGAAYEMIFAAEGDGRRFRHLPRVYECYRTDEQLVVVMEYVRGETLAEAVGACEGAAARAELARSLFPAICDAAAELHEGLGAPVIHRDLKPENIIVSPAGEIALIDFGIARSVRADAARDTVQFGTCAYAPPEQFGFGQTDVRSDVYALGLMLWFCCTGRVPAPADRERCFAAEGLPGPLQQVVARAAAFDPSARYSSASELKRSFLAASAGDGEDVPPSAADGPGAGRPVPAAAAPSAAVPVAPPAIAPRPAAAPRHAAKPSGAVRNLLIAGCYVFVLAACIGLVIEPTGESAGDPLWFLVYEYLVFANALFGLPLFLLLDRRSLAERVPWFSRRSRRQDAMLVALVLILLTVLLGLLAGFAR